MLEIDVRKAADGGIDNLVKDMPKVRGRMVYAVATAYAKEVRKGYLSGQVLGVITGQTRKSVKAVRKDKGVYVVRPGVGIRGGLNYLRRFERGDRPFMGPSFEAFRAGGRPGQIMTAVLEKAQRKAAEEAKR